jgi:hypothetical protein
MLDRFGLTTDPSIAERTAKTCLLVPLGGLAQEAACDPADRAIAMARGHWVQPFAEATRGLTAYRREHFADAVAWADRCLSRGPGDWDRELPAHLVRALALSRLGRRDGPTRSPAEAAPGRPWAGTGPGADTGRDRRAGPVGCALRSDRPKLTRPNRLRCRRTEARKTVASRT